MSRIDSSSLPLRSPSLDLSTSHLSLAILPCLSLLIPAWVQPHISLLCYPLTQALPCPAQSLPHIQRALPTAHITRQPWTRLKTPRARSLCEGCDKVLRLACWTPLSEMGMSPSNAHSFPAIVNTGSQDRGSQNGSCDRLGAHRGRKKASSRPFLHTSLVRITRRGVSPPPHNWPQSLNALGNESSRLSGACAVKESPYPNSLFQMREN